MKATIRKHRRILQRCDVILSLLGIPYGTLSSNSGDNQERIGS